jgi:hypothetical protein
MMGKVSNAWRVTLGRESATQYTHPAIEEQGLRLLGSVSRGGQFGALVQDSEGRFMQMNGDHSTPLNQSQIKAALRRAQAAPDNGKRKLPHEAAAAREVLPVVTIKRRRVIDPLAKEKKPDAADPRGALPGDAQRGPERSCTRRQSFSSISTARTLPTSAG